jgi:hypothetical protein
LHPSINKIIPAYIKIISNPLFYNTNNGLENNSIYKGAYLSPLLFKAVGNKNYNPVHNPFKSDVFTLGIILIECCFLHFCDDLYAWDTFEFKNELLVSYLSKIKAIYGLEVYNLVYRMTLLDENMREDFN